MNALLLALLLASASSAPVDSKKVAGLVVLPLKAEEQTAAAARSLDEMILQAVHDSKRYKPIGAADINALLGVERLKDAAGCSDSTCLAEIGGALGAQFVLSGQLSTLGGEVSLSLRLIDAKKSDVLERAAARGGGDAATLAKMMATTMSQILHVEVPVPASLGGVVASPAPDFSSYTDAVMAFGKAMGANDYSRLLASLDAAEAKPPAVPKGQDFFELTTFYRATACYMLKREKCFREAALKYKTKWPDGLYGTSMQSYLDALDDEAEKRENGKDELKKQLATIKEAKHKDQVLELELTAWAYFSAYEFVEAAKRFDILIGKAADDDKFMDYSGNASMAYQRGGDLKAARERLEQAEKRNAKLFRAKSMHQTLKALPK